MISPQTNLECLGKLGMLRYFPIRDNVLVEIGKMLNDLCLDDQEARTLVSAVCDEYAEWPGPAGIRQVHASAVVAKRPSEALPEPCDICRWYPGYRPVFKVIERGPEGKIDWFSPVGGEQGRWEMSNELRERYKGDRTREVYELIAPCQCPLGQKKRAEMAKRAEGVAR
jgi:hypothetical protein